MLDTIKSSTEISLLFSQGKRFTSPNVTLLVQKGDVEHDPCGRVAFIAGKKLGNAVWRNKAKRRLRAIVKDLGGPWAGFDMVFIAKSPVTRNAYSTVCEQCEKLVIRAMKEMNR